MASLPGVKQNGKMMSTMSNVKRLTALSEKYDLSGMGIGAAIT